MSLIETKNLKKTYELDGVTTVALADASFKIEAGEFVAIMGPSGSGKSTLMHIIGFLDKPTSGEYFFKEKNIGQLSDDEMAKLRNRAIGFVFQSFNLLPRTTVFDNIKLPLMYSDRPSSEYNSRTDKALADVNLEHRRGHFSNQLSGGEKQRVAIARALVNNPDLILADEPTGNLDSKSGAQIMKILQQLNKQGKTIIIVTHEHDVARAAERIIKIKDGAIIEDIKIHNQRMFNDGEELLK